MEVYYVDFESPLATSVGQVFRVRRSAAAQSSASRRLLLGSMLMLIIVLGIQLWLRVVITEKGYEIERMRMVALSNDSELRELDLAYAYRTRPAELIKIAKQKIGLEPMSPNQIRKVHY